MELDSHLATESKENPKFEPGDLVWVAFSKSITWPCRIAKNSEIGPDVIKLQKEGQVYLVYYFGSKNYSWVRPNQVAPWTDFEAELGAAAKKNRSKSFEKGLEEAKRWRNGKKDFPLFKAQPDNEDDTIKQNKKRKALDSTRDAPEPKKSKPVATDDIMHPTAPESDTDEEDMLPYMIPYKDPKKANKVRVMRKLGLYPPEGSPKATKTAPPQRSHVIGTL